MKKSSFFGTIVAILLAAVIVITCGVGSSWFTNGDIRTWFNSWGQTKPSDKDKPNEDDNSDIGDLSDKCVSGNFETAVILEHSALKISMASYSLGEGEEDEYGIEPLSDERIVFTVVPYPSYAVDKDVEWSVDFITTATEEDWHYGKDVEDYVVITPVTDDGLQAYADCLEPFGTQIVITCTLKSNPDVFASCKCDYVIRYLGTAMDFCMLAGGQVPADNPLERHWTTTGENNEFCMFDFPMAGYHSLSPKFTDILSVGTVRKFALGGTHSYDIMYAPTYEVYIMGTVDFATCADINYSQYPLGDINTSTYEKVFSLETVLLAGHDSYTRFATYPYCINQQAQGLIGAIAPSCAYADGGYSDLYYYNFNSVCHSIAMSAGGGHPTLTKPMGKLKIVATLHNGEQYITYADFNLVSAPQPVAPTVSELGGLEDIEF